MSQRGLKAGGVDGAAAAEGNAGNAKNPLKISVSDNRRLSCRYGTTMLSYVEEDEAVKVRDWAAEAGSTDLARAAAKVSLFNNCANLSSAEAPAG